MSRRGMIPLHLESSQYRYRALIGTGGIGTGTFFALQGDETLGREESRLGYVLDRRDYCKLHIVSHYVKILLGSEFAVLPLGYVGDDDAGGQLLREMQAIDLDLTYLQQYPGYPTLFSFCLVYPDGSGGNLTTADSACSQVTAKTIEHAGEAFSRFQGQGIALAMPEVPLEARLRLLQLGRAQGLFCVGSFVSDEIGTVVRTPVLRSIDLLALNIDEAAAVVRLSVEDSPLLTIIEQAIQTLRRIHPTMFISITAGKQGSWIWDGALLSYLPSLEVDVKSTAGAGDAHLSGLIAGLTAGLSLPQAHELATLMAALSVESEHTIHPGLDAQALKIFAQFRHIAVCDGVKKLIRLFPFDQGG
ncbi:hypothetical protein GF339_19065 [candidate division KSB3 bacterium]|uniref:Carbohydrate kinase PfkB domain-containing protein n=1 Tax=candidate division KSB3 bacterium TaxID=2044937 RepID=A0A9D5JYS0_9BACT|nr:hypothetical protein [candidate division KSB3 bacterium]MBD3326693.1 hypothetical protein [candidate division KSB3 bacterium]